MRRHRYLVLLPLVLGLAPAAPAAAADTVVGHLSRPSTIRTYADVQVLSDFDGSAYRLAIRRAGAIERLPVAPSRAPFDVDIGPDRQGRPELVYTRCKGEIAEVDLGTNSSRGCDLVVYSPAGGGERPVRNANTADSSEFAPTLWKGRIAFARRTPGSDVPVVYTKLLTAPRSRPSERLPGVRRRANPPLELGGAVIGLALFAADGAYVIDGEPQDDGCGGSLDPVPRQCRLIRSRPLAFGPGGPRR